MGVGQGIREELRVGGMEGNISKRDVWEGWSLSTELSTSPPPQCVPAGAVEGKEGSRTDRRREGKSRKW